MFSSNPIKISLVLAALFIQSCGFWQGKTDATAEPEPFVAEELKSAIPFSNKEPETFQTEIVLTAEGLEEKTFIARSGARRLIVFNFQSESETSVLQPGDGRSFLINARRKIYAENIRGTFEATSRMPDESLTAEWLNQKKSQAFERLGAENNLMKYRVNLDESTNSEIIIYADEQIGLPVRQEFYSGEGGQKKLTATMELKNFSLQPDAKFFEVPTDYRKLTAKEFRETLGREQIK